MKWLHKTATSLKTELTKLEENELQQKCCVGMGSSRTVEGDRFVLKSGPDTVQATDNPQSKKPYLLT